MTKRKELRTAGAVFGQWSIRGQGYYGWRLDDKFLGADVETAHAALKLIQK